MRKPMGEPVSTATSMTDERLLELLREADPLGGEPPMEAWRTEAALGRLLALAAAQAASAPPARSHLRPSRRLLLSGLGVLGAASAALVLGLPGGNGGLRNGTPKALADWSPTPTAPTAGQVQAAEAACAQLRPYPEEPALSGLTPKVADTRGPFSLLVYVDGRSNQACVVGPSGDASETTSSDGEEAAPAGSVLWRLAGDGSGVEGQAASFVDGQTGEGVTAATLVLEDGTRVKATIANGWFAAWWPGERRASLAEVTTANGTVTEPLPLLQDRPKRIAELQTTDAHRLG